MSPGSEARFCTQCIGMPQFLGWFFKFLYDSGTCPHGYNPHGYKKAGLAARFCHLYRYLNDTLLHLHTDCDVTGTRVHKGTGTLCIGIKTR